MAGTIAPPPSEAHRGKKFLLNVLWNWLGVGVSIVSGLLLSPYMIRKLGPEGYGVWALSFALVEYYWFLDLGFRGATVKYVAHYWARREYDKVSEVVNTGVTFAGIVSACVFVLVIFGARYIDRFFQVSPAYKDSFFILVVLVSMNWCVGVVFSLFGACLEALQRFDIYNRILLFQTMLRVPGTIILLYLGCGLIEIGVLVLSSLMLGYMLHYIYFRKVFPGYRLSVRGASRSMLRQMYNYGIHNFVGNSSTQLLNQTPPILIGHFMPAAFVGYFQVPMRLLQYTGEAIGRIGSMTNASAAEMVAKDEKDSLSQLAVFTNRYCVIIFMPLAIMLFVYGRPFFELWIPKAAAYSAPLLPIMLAGYVIAIVGQFSSSMLLMGMARYKWYSRGLMVETVVSIVSLWFVVPRYGILGAAWVIATAMVLNRGLFLPWLVSRVMKFRYSRFMWSIYGMPVLLAGPMFALAEWLKATVFPGKTWAELAAVAPLVGSLYYILAFLFCLPPEHRTLLKEWVTRKMSAPRYS